MDNEYLKVALGIAIEAHKGQVDKSGKPYILHPLAVAKQLETDELKAIGLLHDTIEDTYVTAEYLLDRGIPKQIVDTVVILTKPDGENYETYLKRVKQIVWLYE